MHLSLTWHGGAACGFVGPTHACMGIDIQASLRAPLPEEAGLNFCTYNETPLALEFLLQFLRTHAPIAVGRGELIPIRHDAEDLGVVVDPVPSDADR